MHADSRIPSLVIFGGIRLIGLDFVGVEAQQIAKRFDVVRPYLVEQVTLHARCLSVDPDIEIDFLSRLTDPPT